MCYQITTEYKKGGHGHWYAFKDIRETCHALTEEWKNTIVASHQRGGASHIVVENSNGDVILDWVKPEEQEGSEESVISMPE